MTEKFLGKEWKEVDGWEEGIIQLRYFDKELGKWRCFIEVNGDKK